MARHKKESSRYNDVTRDVDNSAKTLLANIRFMSVDNPVRTVVITSAIPNEGKTFVSANLARAMATSGVPTLLVESDMRRRSMAKTLNVHAQHGVYSVLSGEVALMDAVVPTDTPLLSFLDSEPHIPNPSDLLNSQRFVRLIEDAKQEFGYVVFDTPPLGTFVDAAVLGSKVDVVLLVVREQFTRKDAIVRAATQLKTANVPLSGIVMNFCDRSSSEYYYYDYYYYREDHKHKGKDRSLKMPAFSLTPASSEPDEAREAAASPVATPKSWGNAPDLDSPSYADEDAPQDFGLTETPDATGDVRKGSLELSLPEIGSASPDETIVVPRLTMEAHVEEVSRDGRYQGDRR